MRARGERPTELYSPSFHFVAALLSSSEGAGPFSVRSYRAGKPAGIDELQGLTEKAYIEQCRRGTNSPATIPPR
jgi:hypothetical protein